MKLLIGCALLAAFSVSMAGQVPAAQLTQGSRNGRFWQAIGDTEKLGLIEGYLEGAIQVIADWRISEELRTALVETYSGSSTIGEIVKGLDGFYAEPANARIPIRAAISLFRAKVNGISPAEFEKQVAVLRELASR